MNQTNRLGLGMGMDLEWGNRIGFIRDRVGGDRITDKMKHFFDHYHDLFNYIFIAFQPKNRNELRASDYFQAYDYLYDYLGDRILHRAFHHTLLNLGTMDNYDRQKIFKFTNDLIHRYNFEWVVEDLGIWTLNGKTVPYPLPPFMTEAGLEACIHNVEQVVKNLDAPLYLEFPGFTEGTNFHIGHYHAFDYFRIIAEETGTAVTIDIGHILSYQWIIGNQGERMFDDLERLPLEQCREFHLSGCQITNGKFRDLHHGVLLDEQIKLLEYLITRCPNLRGVTYEDPQYTSEGILIPKSLKNFQRMKAIVDEWAEEDNLVVA